MKILQVFLVFLIGSLCHGQTLSPEVADIPMRDGKFLKADIHFNDSTISRPVILIQTPYNRIGYRLGLPLGFGTNISSSPYHFVIVDWRGFYGSLSAATTPMPPRGEDGYDLIDWIKDQTWCTGKVGTWGGSALGVVQYQTAREQHPNHSCAVPLVADPQTSYEQFYPGGILERSYVETLDQLGFGVGQSVYANPTYNLIWQLAESSTWYPDEINIPMLLIGGWYDHNIQGTLSFFEGLRTQSDVAVRDKHKIMIGPWIHGGVGALQQGELQYANAQGYHDSLALACFEYYLLGQANGYDQLHRYWYYPTSMSGNFGGWYTSDNDPFYDHPYYLHNLSFPFLSDQTILGTGVFMDSLHSFTSDPTDPFPTLGGPTLNPDLDQGPYDQSSLIANRSDQLTYVFEADFWAGMDIHGRTELVLYISSDRPDFDIHVRLSQEMQSGEKMNIAQGCKRVRFRRGLTANDTMNLSPGTIDSIRISLDPIYTYYGILPVTNKYHFTISASNFSMYDLNLQNGDSMYVAGDTLNADINIHIGPSHPSRVIFETVLQASSIEEPLSKEWNIYPNPTHGELYLNMGEYDQETIFHIFDIQGKEYRVLWKDDYLDVGHLNPGIYFLSIENKNGSFCHRFIKQ